MAEPDGYDDPGPPILDAPSRIRRTLTIAVLLLLVVSMVFLAYVSGRGILRAVPEVRPSSSPIATSVASSRLAVTDAAGRLSVIDGSGGSVVGYGEPGIAYGFPAWSPDGTRIAVVGQGPVESVVSVVTVVLVHDVGASPSAPTVVYRSADRPPFYLYWAPDGGQLTFLTREPDGIALRLVQADDRAPAVVVRTGAPIYWAWIDPGRLLVHSGADGPTGFVAEVRTDGVSVEPDVIQPGGFRAPAVSSDGRFRALAIPGQGTPGAILVEGRDRSDPHTLDIFGGAAIDFGPGASDLAFLAPARAGPQAPLPIGPLRLIGAASGLARTLLAGSVVAFFWSPDGRTIAALEIPGTGDDQVAEGRGITLIAAAPAIRPVASAGLALRLVFVDVAAGSIRAQRPLRVSDMFVQQVIPFFDQYALSHRIWSADSAAVVIPVVADDGTDRLEVVRADGTDARNVAAGISGFWSP